ncbi:MAG: EamA/RhaT family transporter, partial [Syntrophorhabdales bacterium]
MKRKDRVDLIGFLILTGCTLLWGLNYPVVKLTNTGLSPVFNSLMRSVIASVFGIGYCLYIKQPLFHK